MARGSPLKDSSGAAVFGEDGESSEVERETEDGEAGDDCSSDTESLGKLEVGMVTLSFEPGKQSLESKKKICLCRSTFKVFKQIPYTWGIYIFNKNQRYLEMSCNRGTRF